jgi:hypothetical protein
LINNKYDWFTGNPVKTSYGTWYIGPATISLPAGKLTTNVPTTVSLFNDGSISILVDPKTTNFHLNTPIEGKIVTPLNLL